jgi:segregation and condensation protein B
MTFNEQTNQVERIIEALLFSSKDPVSIQKLSNTLPENTDLESVITDLQKKYESKGINLKRVGNFLAFRTAIDLQYLFSDRKIYKKTLSRAAKETLTIIAYHQPVSKLEIEEIRGVTVSSSTLETLMEMGWVKLGKRKDSPGRPLTFRITEKFLDHFDLSSTKDLPGLGEMKELGISVKKINQRIENI